MDRSITKAQIQVFSVAHRKRAQYLEILESSTWPVLASSDHSTMPRKIAASLELVEGVNLLVHDVAVNTRIRNVKRGNEEIKVFAKPVPDLPDGDDEGNDDDDEEDNDDILEFRANAWPQGLHAYEIEAVLREAKHVAATVSF